MPTPAIRTKQNLPVVALVGRVNVGKSTLFNKLIEENKALVSNIPGTTRTSNEGLVLWRGKEFKLIDTGGLTFDETIPFETQIIAQSKKAITEADVIVFVTDVSSGILPQEKELSKILRSAKKPILLVANKADSQKKENSLDYEEWSKLNLGLPLPISGTNGRNLGDLLDSIHTKCNRLKKRPKQPKEIKKEIINISLIGKPNVGKSSLFNKLIGEDKVLISEIPHTTRESHDIMVEYNDRLLNFVDTAGIRRKAKVSGLLERVGIGKSLQSIENSEMILFVVDGSEVISSQDMQLGGLLEKRSKSVIILINKWDLAEDNSEENQKQVKRMVYANFPHLKFAPVMFVSGKTGTNIHKIFPLIEKIWQSRHTVITEHDLELFLSEAVFRKQPGRGKGTRHPKLLGLRQINSNPPIFELFVKHRTSVHSSYVHYLENRLREQFDFSGTPIVIKLTKTKR